MNELSPEVRQKIDEVIHEYPDAWKGQICAFCLIDRKTGKEAEVRYRNPKNGDVCHAGLSSATHCEIVVNAHQKKWQNVNKDFLLWVVKEAPFNHGIINRDNDEQLLNHAAAYDTKIIGQGGTLWQCKAMRHFTEDSYKLKTWSDLREEGLNGLQAFIGADILNSAGGPQYYASHTGLFGYASPKKLRQFYNEISTKKALDGSNASRNDFNRNERVDWGSPQGMKVKKKDGWGGFVEVFQPCSVKDYAEKLREIFEGDPNNVK